MHPRVCARCTRSVVHTGFGGLQGRRGRSQESDEQEELNRCGRKQEAFKTVLSFFICRLRRDRRKAAIGEIRQLISLHNKLLKNKF